MTPPSRGSGSFDELWDTLETSLGTGVRKGQDVTRSFPRASAPADRPPAPDEQTSGPEDRASAPDDRTPAPEDRASAPDDRTPASEDRTPAPADLTTAPGETSGKTTLLLDRTAPFPNTLRPGPPLPGTAEGGAMRAPGGSAVDASATGPDDESGALPDFQPGPILGEGGMGQVHLALQRSLERNVAIKTVRPECLDPGTAEMLLYEGQVMGQLEHPNIIPVHALGTDAAGRPHLVMKRIEGVSWSALIRDTAHVGWGTGEGLPEDRLPGHLEILLAVCNAMSFAHSRGVVHRDLKPSNIMIGPFGEVYVLDWGVALRINGGKMPDAHRNVLVGTPAYLAPEMLQADDRVIDERTDVYLLGACLHEVLVGTPRHGGPELRQALEDAFLSAPYPYPETVPAELAALANRATHRDKASRPQSARALRDELLAYLSHRGSIQLHRIAAERLEHLKARVSDRSGDAGIPVRKLFTEAHFGCLMALREWDANPGARATLQEALEVMIGYEIQHRNADGAGELMLELLEPRPALEADLERLRRQLEEERQGQVELSDMKHQGDLSVSRRQRVLFDIAVGVVFLAMAIVLQLEVGASDTIRVGPAGVLLSGSICVLNTLGIFVGRRSLLSNQANRRMTYLMALCPGVIFVHRLLILPLEVTRSMAVPVDLLLVAAIVSCGAVAIAARLWMIAAMLVGAAFASVWQPTHASQIMLVAVSLAWFTAALLWSGRMEK